MPRQSTQSLLNRIHHQDCVEGLKQLGDNSVHLAFADPPFNIGYKYDVYQDRKESDQYIDWCSSWMTEIYRVLKPDGTFWLAIGDEYAAELKISAQNLGFRLRSWVIWYYTFGVHCTNKFTRSHAHLFYFTKHSKNFTFNKSEIAVPSARQLIYGDKRANPAGRTPDDTWILRPQDARESFQPNEDIWYFPRVNGTFKERAGFHGCQMPEQLLGRIVRSCSNPEEIVLDPFSGSATTLVVAKKLNRRFVGFELSEEYSLRGAERLERTLIGDKLEGVEDPRTSVKSQQEAALNGSAKNGVKKSAPKKVSERLLEPASRLPIDSLRQGFLQESIRNVFRVTSPEQVSRLRTAFLRVGQGASIEQLIIDPELNAEFQKACDQLACDLNPVARNYSLFKLRSSGELWFELGDEASSPSFTAEQELDVAGDEACRLTTELESQLNTSWYSIDASVYAAEIGWRKTLDHAPNLSLEEIFSNPRLASIYDGVAQSIATGFTSLELRRVVLLLREELTKETIRWAGDKKLASIYFPIDGAASLRISDASGKKWPSLPAAYRIVDDQGAVAYQSTTLNLARRVKNQFSSKSRKRLEPWIGPAESLVLEWREVEIPTARPLQQAASFMSVPTALNLLLSTDS